jgi:phospholipid/cholesterol/gamma-HCH transport system substrate-binding protein
MESNTRRDFILGIVFFGTLALLLYYTIVLTGFSLNPKTSLMAWFPDARGLKEGDAVHVAGRPTGTVRDVILDYERPEETRIGVTMEFAEPPQLREGYTMAIVEYSALGGRVVEIDPGPPGARPIGAGVELSGSAEPGALEVLRELVEENREDLRAALSSLRTSLDDITAGKGLLGALINDTSMRDDLDRTLADLRGIADDVRAGKGALGALIADEPTRERMLKLLDDAGAAMTDIREVANAAREGEGLLGALLNDPQMKEDASRLLENLEITSERLREFADNTAQSQGLLGRLLYDEELAMDASAFMDDLAEVARRLKEGEGSLGQLMAKDEAYDGFLEAIRSLNAQLEDARESQPISSFAGMLFGAF